MIISFEKQTYIDLVKILQKQQTMPLVYYSMVSMIDFTDLFPSGKTLPNDVIIKLRTFLKFQNTLAA